MNAFFRNMLSLAACLVTAIVPLTAQPDSHSLILPDVVVAKLALQDSRSPQPVLWDLPEARSLMQNLGIQSVSRMFPGHFPPSAPGEVDLSRIYELKLQPDADPEQLARQLSKFPQIEYAEPKVLHETFYVPNDPYPDTTDGSAPWFFSQVKAFEAWDISRGDTAITIAVIDAGQSRHVDLYPNIAFNHDDPIDGIDNDADGYTDNYEGWDFSGNTYGGIPDNDPFIGNVHGLWVAGVSSAKADNAKGTAGTGFHCRLLPIKAAPDDSLGLIFAGYESIVYAADQGAQIINCSWGSSRRTRLGEDIVDYATLNRKAAVVAASGNSQSEAAFYPAAYDRALSVANTTFGDTLFAGNPNYSGSTYHRTVDVCAPGYAITSCVGTNGYLSAFGGTSFSAPVVSGGVGLILAHYPELTPFQAAQRMRVTADDIEAINSNQYQDKMGLGRVNFFRALTDPLKPSVRMVNATWQNQDGQPVLRPGDTVTVWVEWQNHLHPSTTGLDLRAELSLLNTVYMTVLDEGHQPGAVSMNQRFSGKMITFVMSQQTPEDYPVTFRLSYEDTAVLYRDFEYLTIRANPTWLNIDINDIHTTLTSTGNIGYGDFPNNNLGQGLSLESGQDVLFEAGLLLSSSFGNVSDRIRNQSARDLDFRILTSLYQDVNDKRADLVIKGRFDDAGAAAPIGMTIDQELFGWDDTDQRQFLILQFILHNNNGQTLPDLYASLFTDWDIVGGLDNRNGADYVESLKLAYAEDLTGTNPNRYGVTVLSEAPFSTYAVAAGGPFTFSTTGKATAMRASLAPSTGKGGYPNGADIFQFTNTGPMQVPGNGTDTVTFALLAGLPAELPTIRAAAYNAWICDVLEQGPVLSFSAPAATQAGTEITFADQNAKATTWSWNFGDGSTATGASPAHTYAAPGDYLVRLTVSDGTCTSVHRKSVTVGESVSLEDAPSETLSVVPNPNSGLFHIQLAGFSPGEVVLTMHDLQGRQVWQTTTVTGLETMEIPVKADLPAGVYVLRASSGQRQFHIQVMVK